MRRRGFTILELVMVIGIIAVLMTIVITSVSGSIKRARVQHAAALCTLVQNGIITYHAQKGKWPWGEVTRASDFETATVVLEGPEVRKAIMEIIREAKEHNNPMMDISGLYVSTHPGEPGMRDLGMDFMTAIRGTRRNPKRHKVSELYFGYPGADHGYFRRFYIAYVPVSDSIVVRTFNWQEEMIGAESLANGKH